GVGENDDGLVETARELRRRQRQILPLAPHIGAVPPVERRVDFTLARVEYWTHRERCERQERRHCVERRHRGDRRGERERQPLDGAEAASQTREPAAP